MQTVQIIFNMLRLKPAEALLPGGQASAGSGILARVPLASGLLSGKMTKATTFAADDHRRFNRNGEAFDKGETFSGVPFELGLEVVERLRPLVPAGATLAQLALRFILMFDAVTLRDPGRQVARAGAGQRRRGGAGAAAARDARGRGADLRRGGAAARPRELVGGTLESACLATRTGKSV